MDILERIAEELAEIFPDITIYSENQSSGFDVPSFYINKISTKVTPHLFENQNRTYSYQIVYFGTSNADIDRVEDLLLNNFTQLKEFCNVVNRDFDADHNELTLSFTFDLVLNAYKVNDDVTMKANDVNGGIKESNG